MKNIKIIIMLLIVCLIFTACSSPDNSSANTDDGGNTQSPNNDAAAGEIIETTTESYYETLGEKDFGGDTFTILDANMLPDLFVGNKPFVSAYEKREPNIQKDIDKFIESMLGNE